MGKGSKRVNTRPGAAGAVKEAKKFPADSLEEPFHGCSTGAIPRSFPCLRLNVHAIIDEIDRLLYKRRLVGCRSHDCAAQARVHSRPRRSFTSHRRMLVHVWGSTAS